MTATQLHLVLLIGTGADRAEDLRRRLHGVVPGGFDVEHARCLDDALPLLDEADFDVVVFDMDRPGDCGAAAIQRLTRRHPWARVVGLAAAPDLAMAEQTMQAGGQDLVAKDAGSFALARSLVCAVHRQPPAVQTPRRPTPACVVTLDQRDRSRPLVILEDPRRGIRHRVTYGNRSSMALVLARAHLEGRPGKGASRGWCTDNEVIVGVWGRLAVDRTCSSYYVLVHRLRKELGAAGIDPAVIQKRPRQIRVSAARVLQLVA